MGPEFCHYVRLDAKSLVLESASHFLEAVRAGGGTALAVSDAELVVGMHRLARTEGIFVSPEAGAAVVAAERLRESSFLGPDDEVVLFATGSGLKHVDMVEAWG